MSKIVGYFSTGQTWRVIDEKEYRKVFLLNPNLAISYLKHEIMESVEREMGVILSGTKAGFYAGLRFLFPEVVHLAHLYYGYKGNDWKFKESKFTARFMRKFKILYPQCGLYFEVFRHGLIHGHHPKWLRKGKSVNEWYVSNTEKLDMFGVSLPELTKTIKTAILEFIDELENKNANKNRYRLRKFLDALSDCGKILKKKDLKGYAKYDKRRNPEV
ncbi:MAG: hypothetical protein A3D74_05410 [Candidatus Levybacteria bacterium RIFCSPHIGHO2_02_FULL_37_13]|nr:MAG: hypothetical protein A3D74_05410 [Candidatus Levybacteria bacterium RIFCSPHIGHO2_02_FULL_37_13]OGH30391.1 MAG: hypothetical protein A3E40_04095 [Candidatus Levybacteria bacterium RIFCSPHIGHO2_12_FULL_37_9]OGH40383.1 MAG: hypothetical protein A3B41_02635 [Candidatus Levybacteria bacterium RIFCSPLOWO2_01_FULL_37_26]